MPEHVDLYCERIGTGLWAEPVNAVTNVGFIVVAALLWGMARRLDRLTPGIQVIIMLLAAIGVGSFLFHTFATPATRLLDIVPILLFTATYLWLYARQVMVLGHVSAGALLVAFLVLAYGGRQFPHLLNGSLMYAPAFAVVLAFGVYHHLQRKMGRNDLLIATAIFLVSLCFRTIDNAICSSIPLGTHFLWHVMNAAALLFAMRGLLRNYPASQIRIPVKASGGRRP